MTDLYCKRCNTRLKHAKAIGWYCPKMGCDEGG